MLRQPSRCLLFGLILLAFFVSSCRAPGAALPLSAGLPTQTATHLPSATFTATATPSPTITSTATATLTPTASATATVTLTPTETLTPTITLTETVTPSPTYDFPDVTVKVAQAHCRYGPATGYLHAADLYQGDHGTVRGRNNSATWLYVKFDKLHYFCWVAASVVEVEGNVMLIYPVERKLPVSVLYGPPDDVQAVRTGNTVRVTWDKVNMTEDDDRGYMIEAYVCQEGRYLFVVVATNNTFYEFTDEPGCPQPSGGLLYTVEKHGYTDPVKIPWPAP